MVLVLVLQVLSCKDRFPSKYALELPKAPEHWVSLLGEPSWRIEWLSPDGYKQMTDIMYGGALEIELPVTWTNPVTAWPYWPEHNLIPGFLKPAGALFPFDVSEGRLCLTWPAGVDSVFFWEMAHANEDNYSRIPVNFDWLRFRELFEQGILSEAVCEDPWLVNWQSVAERTVAGNFDRRRLVPEQAEFKTIPVPEGEWYGASPFAKSLLFTEGEPLVFPVRQGINVWFSSRGILRANGNVWVFIEW